MSVTSITQPNPNRTLGFARENGMLANTRTLPAATRIQSLESLRGLMAIWVMLGHLLPTAGIRWGRWPGLLSELGEGIHAVNVFLILSGFVIFMLLDSARERFSPFIVRRFFRLFPAYLVCLLAAIILLDINSSAYQLIPWAHPVTEFMMRTTQEVHNHYFAHLAAHLSLLHGVVPQEWLPESGYTFLAQGWSLSLEWQFYLIAPLIFALVSRRLVYFIPVLLVAYAAHRYLYGDNAFLPTSIYYFLVGIGSYYLWKYRNRIALPAFCWVLAVPAAAIATPLLTGSISLSIWAIVFTAMLSRASGTASPFERAVHLLLEHKSAIYLGRISYSVYLSHTIVITLVLAALVPYARQFSQWSFLALMGALVIPLTLAVSSVLYRYVEQPGIRTGKQIANRRRYARRAKPENSRLLPERC